MPPVDYYNLDEIKETVEKDTANLKKKKSEL